MSKHLKDNLIEVILSKIKYPQFCSVADTNKEYPKFPMKLTHETEDLKDSDREYFAEEIALSFSNVIEDICINGDNSPVHFDQDVGERSALRIDHRFFFNGLRKITPVTYRYDCLGTLILSSFERVHNLFNHSAVLLNPMFAGYFHELFNELTNKFNVITSKNIRMDLNKWGLYDGDVINNTLVFVINPNSFTYEYNSADFELIEDRRTITVVLNGRLISTEPTPQSYLFYGIQYY